MLFGKKAVIQLNALELMDVRAGVVGQSCLAQMVIAFLASMIGICIQSSLHALCLVMGHQDKQSCSDHRCE
jgi:hypothetical protein